MIIAELIPVGKPTKIEKKILEESSSVTRMVTINRVINESIIEIGRIVESFIK